MRVGAQKRQANASTVRNKRTKTQCWRSLKRTLKHAGKQAIPKLPVKVSNSSKIAQSQIKRQSVARPPRAPVSREIQSRLKALKNLNRHRTLPNPKLQWLWRQQARNRRLVTTRNELQATQQAMRKLKLLDNRIRRNAHLMVSQVMLEAQKAWTNPSNLVTKRNWCLAQAATKVHKINKSTRIGPWAERQEAHKLL